MTFPVWQSSLYPTMVHLRDARLPRAGFFPFFDRFGEVFAYMLVWSGSPWIVLLDARPGLIVRSRPLTLGVTFGQLQNLHPDRLARYGKGWHYDPWWLLGKDRYQGHSAVPVLKATNAVEPLESMLWGVRFRPDLSRVLGDLRPHLPERPESPPVEETKLPRRRVWVPKGWAPTQGSRV